MQIREWLTKNNDRVDWNGIFSDWLNMQRKYNILRNKQVDIITDGILRLPFEKLNVIDLCCGPGTVSKALLEKDKRINITGIDADVFLLSVCRNILEPFKDRVEFIEGDVRDDKTYKFDKEIHAVVSLTALHWLSESSHEKLYKTIYKVLSRGGIFINADRTRNKEKELAPEGSGMTWEAFWESLYKKYGFKNEIEEMHNAISIWEGTDEGYSRDFYITALQKRCCR